MSTKAGQDQVPAQPVHPLLLRGMMRDVLWPSVMVVMLLGACQRRDGPGLGHGAQGDDAGVAVAALLPPVRRVVLVEDAAHFIGRPTKAAMDAATGRLYVADLQMREVKWFHRDGTFGAVLGRAGAGPGEYGAPVDVAIDAGSGALLVLDVSRDGIIAYSLTSGALLAASEVPTQLIPRSVIPVGGDTILLAGVNREWRDGAPLEVAVVVTGSDSVVRYLGARPRTHRGKGILVSIGGAIGARGGENTFFAHMLHPMLYRLDRRLVHVDSMPLPSGLITAAVLPDTVPGGGPAAMRDFMRGLEFITMIVPLDDTTAVLGV